MSSNRIPTTQCVHIFNGEFAQLINRLEEPIGLDGLSCYLYGLWTHSSNVVVHLVVSNNKEYGYARTHRLDCVGYVAKRYTKHLYDIVHDQTVLSPRRQHIIVDVSETKRSNSLQAYGSHRDVFRKSEDPSSQGQRLQVNILPSESPFRKELYKTNPEMKNINGLIGHKVKSENGFGSYSDVLSTTADPISQELLKVGNESQVGKELYDMNRGSGRANINENSIESETASYHGNQMNGHQDKIDQSSILIILIKSLKHKIKDEFELEDIPVEESFEKSSLVLRFEHNGKQWRIELKEDQASSKTLVEIFFSELTEAPSSPVKAYSQEFVTSQPVVNKIKELCQCEKCNK